VARKVLILGFPDIQPLDVVGPSDVFAGASLALSAAGKEPYQPFVASAKTNAAATALMVRDGAKPAQLKAGTLLLWDRALSVARAKAARR
jgi:hypothetical protein